MKDIWKWIIVIVIAIALVPLSYFVTNLIMYKDICYCNEWAINATCREGYGIVTCCPNWSNDRTERMNDPTCSCPNAPRDTIVKNCMILVDDDWVDTGRRIFTQYCAEKKCYRAKRL